MGFLLADTVNRPRTFFRGVRSGDGRTHLNSTAVELCEHQKGIIRGDQMLQPSGFTVDDI